jgi:leucyl aminopeptidase (aminopeptidase T)
MPVQQAALNIAQYYFHPPAGKPVVIACDAEKLELARALAAALESLGHPTILPVLEGEPSALIQAMDRLLDDGSIALAVFASHKMWVDLGLNKRFTIRDRQPSLRGRPEPLFFDAVTPLESLLRLYAADTQAIQIFLDGLQRNLPDFATFRLTTPAGTDLSFTARHWQPWGWEMMTCPVEDSVQGQIVVDAGVFFDRISQPIELVIQAGKLTSMRCPDPDDAVFRQYRQWMMEAMELNSNNAQLAEVGLGANPGAQISEVVMESEAVQGTLHVCFGDNAMFEGMDGQTRTGWHGGTVILKKPHLTRA